MYNNRFLFSWLIYHSTGICVYQKGKVGSAINFLDIAVTAKKCADRLHDEFWKVLDGKLTEEEFKIFCEAETLSQEKNKVYIELNMEINKQLSI